MSDAARAPRAFVLRQGTGLEATILDWGATLARLRAPGRDGRLADLVLGFDDFAAYQGPHPSLGGVVGRYANRIAGARFTLDGRCHALVANDGRHCLHGGPRGFDRRFWDAERCGDHELLLVLRSPDGDQGFPGNLEVSLRYRLEGAALHLETRATCDAPTVVSLASHAYWNLEDGGATPILEHRLAIAAERHTPIDAEGIPTGAIEPVAGTPLDFRAPRFGAVALEAQQFPNAPNEPGFPSARLDPGETQQHTTVFEISLVD